ncbi:hypothetical protein [Amycolatopsis pigmentata]|uniref:Uncharacterized protein n=1 Tax=Amycolatopsis pigmentata TaxID=450801 RepID=A0ABW5FZH7_9PSEU
MSKAIRRPRGARRIDVMEVWYAPKQWWPILVLGVLVRWRVEIVLTVAWLTGMAWLFHEVGPTAAWFIFAGLVVVIALVPATRWFVFARFWCVLDRHRLRTCLRQARARTMNLDGALPFMLWARPAKTGERVWLWTRAGSSAGDIEAVLEYIAPACYAREARVHTVRRLSTLFAVDIVRRDPLDRSTPIDSPLAKIATFVGRKSAAEGTEPIRAATVVPLPTTPKKATREPSRPSVVASGEDLSDYID